LTVGPHDLSVNGVVGSVDRPYRRTCSSLLAASLLAVAVPATAADERLVQAVADQDRTAARALLAAGVNVGAGRFTGALTALWMLGAALPAPVAQVESTGKAAVDRRRWFAATVSPAITSG
jgi:hypothetical protein